VIRTPQLTNQDTPIKFIQLQLHNKSPWCAYSVETSTPWAFKKCPFFRGVPCLKVIIGQNQYRGVLFQKTDLFWMFLYCLHTENGGGCLQESVYVLFLIDMMDLE
jgi:hypothetical protein